ncbi:Multidrug resistance protein NorM [Roseibaca ekhonensis]|uniref:Multidrug resistance protein NorM n=1 Tax=Roseinatronobacter ekhonensis TaxID=254356 RepID=A0A3B0MI75_9RHOB|nr:MATE family efflux transporter [Roseibaca ekhonensis]SUZ33248.1 Multidrug resistance protein NorM [Roseibaca ekhonensis]
MPNIPKAETPITPISLVRTALPIGAFYLTEILVGLTDLAVVGALGTTDLAAVGLGKTILLSVMVIGFAVLSIGTVLMAEKPNPARCGAVVLASVAMIIPFVTLAIIVANASGAILTASGYDPDFIVAFDRYAGILAWAIAPALLFSVLKNVLNAVERTAAITWLSIGIVLGNLMTSIALVHGIGAWQGLGVAGAAWATLGVNACAAIALLGLVLCSDHVRVRRLRRHVVVRFMADIIRLGWAAGAQQALESVLFIVVLYLLGLYSTLWLAAGTLVFAIMELNYAASGALGEVLAARIAANRSKGHANLTRLLRIGGIVAGVVAACIALVAGIFADATVTLFSSSDISSEVRSLMVNLLRWTAPFFVFDALQIVYIHALRGLRQTVMPMLLSTSCYWVVGLGGGMFLAEATSFGALGVWIGFCLGLACAAVLLSTIAFCAARRLG